MGIDIKINGKKVRAKKGEMILDACRRSGVLVPSLCSFEGLPKENVCRVCLVEINKTKRLVPACSFPVCQGLEVSTESERAKEARKINLELLWSDHAGRCSKCKKNRICELQDIAEKYQVENFHFIPRREEMTANEELDLLKDNKSRYCIDEENKVIEKNGELCVECRRCINICEMHIFGFNRRGSAASVGTAYNQSLDCIFCGQCSRICPTGSLIEFSDQKKIIDRLQDDAILSIALVDPSIFDNEKSKWDILSDRDRFLGLLKTLGFESLFDLTWGMSAFSMEIEKEIRISKKDVIASHCPAMIMFIEKEYPRLADLVTRIDLPDELMATEIKKGYSRRNRIDPEKIDVFSITNCVAKKRHPGKNLDGVITPREIFRLCLSKNIQEENITKKRFDKIEGNIGGDFEKKSLYNGSIRSYLPDHITGDPSSIFVSGVKESVKILDAVGKNQRTYRFIELMACPGRCAKGGGAF